MADSNVKISRNGMFDYENSRAKPAYRGRPNFAVNADELTEDKGLFRGGMFGDAICRRSREKYDTQII